MQPNCRVLHLLFCCVSHCQRQFLWTWCHTCKEIMPSQTQTSAYLLLFFFYFMAENTQNGHHTVTQSRRENGRQHSRHTLMIGAQEKKLWAFLCGDCHFHNCKTLNCSLEVNWGPTVIFECGGTYRWSLSLMKGCLSVLKWACVCGSRWTSKSGMSGWNGVFILAAKESHIPAIPALFRSSHFWSVDTKQNNKKRQRNKQNIAFRIGMGHN